MIFFVHYWLFTGSHYCYIETFPRQYILQTVVFYTHLWIFGLKSLLQSSVAVVNLM